GRKGRSSADLTKPTAPSLTGTHLMMAVTTRYLADQSSLTPGPGATKGCPGRPGLLNASHTQSGPATFLNSGRVQLRVLRHSRRRDPRLVGSLRPARGGQLRQRR